MMIGACLPTTKKNQNHRPGVFFPPTTRAVLQCLGITWQQPMDEIMLLTMSSTTAVSSTSTMKVSLQQDDDDENHNSTTTGSSKRRRRRRMVQFDEKSAPTTILTIPSHDSYTTQERKDTWCGSAEMAMMVHRNRREFSSEGWDWRNVKEEDEMYFDQTTHTYIHPVHLGGRLI